MSETEKVSKLTAALGETGAAAVMNMLGKTDQLKTSMEKLAEISGNTPAVEMAKKMTDEMAIFTAGWNNLKISFGSAILPLFNLLLSGIAATVGGLAALIDCCPPVRWALGFLTMAIFGVAVAFGTLKIVLSLRQMFLALKLALQSTAAKMIYTKVCTVALTMAKYALTAAIWLAAKGALVAYAAGWLMVKGVLIAVKVITAIVTGVQWLFNLALWSCPITWIVLGIVALIAAIVALIVYWDEVTAFVYKYADAILAILGPIGWVVLAFKHWDTIKEIIGSIWDYIKEFFNWIGGVAGKIGNFFAKFFGGNNSVNIENIRNDQPVVEGGAVGRNKDIAAGGVRNTTNNSNTTNYGGVTINSSRALTPGELEEYMLLQS